MPVKKNKSKGNAVMINEYYDTLDQLMEKYGEKTILFWQCGDFYEVYAKEENPRNLLEFVKICDFTYSQENGNLKAGVPKKAAQKWANRIVENGYTLIVYDQYDDITNKKKKIRKEAYKLSPGNSIINTNNDNNYSCVIWIETFNSYFHNNTMPYFYCGISIIDSFTGKSVFYEYKYQNNNIHNTTAFDKLDRFISIYQPVETIFIHNYKEPQKIDDITQFISLQSKKIYNVNLNDNTNTQTLEAKNAEKQTYQKEIFTRFFDFNEYNVFLETTRFSLFPYAASAYCFLLEFIHQHNPQLINKISYPIYEINSLNVHLATHCLKQLNIIDTEQSNKEYSSILKFINKCKTVMGKRRFKNIILHPSVDTDYLNNEYNIIDFLINEQEYFTPIRQKLNYINDIEKLYRKINLSVVKPNELAHLYQNINTILEIKTSINSKNKYKKYLNQKINSNIQNNLNSIKKKLETTLNIDNCIKYNYSNKECNNIFNKNIYSDIDVNYAKYKDCLQTLNKIKEYLTALAIQNDKSAKNVNTDTYIKIHYTEKSGINLELTGRRAEFLKQAAKNINSNETFNIISEYTAKPIPFKFNPSMIKYTGKSSSSSTVKLSGSFLSELYKKIFQSTHIFNETMKSRFEEFVESLIKYNNELNNIVEYISLIDITLTKAYISDKYNYCKPKINSKPKKAFFDVKQIRHPLIEHIQQDEIYVTNDLSIGKKKNGILLYGTNAVGKSSLIKSIGINIILAQSGMYVAAGTFTFKPYHSIFTRILGNDNIFKGLSTFAVEMCELRTILNNCNENSLILGDELCSGTEIISALSIFTAGIHHFSNSNSSYIFATHFHELNKMKIIKDLLKNKKLVINHMAVQYDKQNDMLIYTRKLEDGPGNNMYGLEVCKALNMPDGFVDFAFKIRNNEVNEKSILSKKKTKYSGKKLKNIVCEICNINPGQEIHHLNPQELADVKGFINTHHKNHSANLINICTPCHRNITKNNIILKKTKTSKGLILMEQ